MSLTEQSTSIKPFSGMLGKMQWTYKNQTFKTFTTAMAKSEENKQWWFTGSAASKDELWTFLIKVPFGNNSELINQTFNNYSNDFEFICTKRPRSGTYSADSSACQTPDYEVIVDLDCQKNRAELTFTAELMEEAGEIKGSFSLAAAPSYSQTPATLEWKEGGVLYRADEAWLVHDDVPGYGKTWTLFGTCGQLNTEDYRCIYFDIYAKPPFKEKEFNHTHIDDAFFYHGTEFYVGYSGEFCLTLTLNESPLFCEASFNCFLELEQGNVEITDGKFSLHTSTTS